MAVLAPTPRTTLKRAPTRGSHEIDTLHRILDLAPIVHVGINVHAQPAIIPTFHLRIGDALYFHGSTANRMFRVLASGEPACVTASLIDGLVLARSAFHHSMNYRSVVIYGTAETVNDATEKAKILTGLIEKLVPGRSKDARAPNETELKRTLLIRFPIVEASAKIRSGGPIDDEEDYESDIWAGVVPLKTVALSPIRDDLLPDSIPQPEYLSRYLKEHQ